ncbi:hypothetical protein QH639_20300 [Lysinibacillus sp. 1 U-2021]|uniref:hypothetical protein n=1 Tax=Lysinibacillus sp. 1 U-2021 TaxID=3039426 RepID=UPI0024800743|nr:hypothetical protein [Lysinibacillus sp. 1 U-2021]WGT38140.1 hypothetical protein QH639_20300 [Lysinibacillus sp. 1 U-2021]
MMVVTPSSRTIINNYNQMMKENAVRTFSESELEQKVILERMKENASKVSAEQAAEVVKNAVKQKEEVIKEANDTYDQKYKLIIKMRDETGDISAEEADKMIAEAKKSRDQTIKLAEERHEKIISEAQKQADEHVGKVNWETGEIVSKWDMMKSAVGRKAREIVDDTKNKWEEAKKVTAEKWEAIKSWPGKKIDEMKSAVSTKMGEVKTTIQTKWNEAESFLKNVNLLQVGKDIINGLVKGIGSMAESVWKKVEGIADGITSTAKKILGIKSPSRVFRQIGLWTGEGMAIGLDESSPRVNKAMSNIGDGILAVSKNYQKEYTNLIDEFNRKNEDKNDKTLEKIYKIQNKAAKKKRDLTQKELQDIALLQASYRDNKLKADQDFNKKYKALVEKSEKEYLEVIKSYIADKKSLEELTLIDEAKVWEQSMELFAEGTAERIKAQQEYKKAVEAVNKEITAINNDYSNQILKINEDLAKQEETLTKAYTDAVDKRAQSLVSFKSLFDEFKVEIDVTGGELLANLKSQVDGFILWQKEIEKLSERAIDQGLLAELREMGPKALGELKALNGLTDDQLKQYSELYKEKSALARKQAETELIGMKNDTDKQITNLRRAASAQLDTLNTEWQQKIKALTQTTSSELSSLEQIGKDAGQGLLNGLGSMQGPLEKKAREIADSITKTMKSALDIHSPSRVMKQIGIWTVEGLALGIEDSSNMVLSASQNIVKKVAQTFEELPDLIDGYEKRYFKDSQSIMDKFLEIYTTKDAYGVEALKFLKTALEMEHLSYYDRLAILKEYENQKELASYRLVQMEKDYSKKVIEIEEERTRKQSELLAQYETEVTKRTEEIYKQFGLLDKVELKSITGDEMLTSLDSQIIAMETYTTSIEKLVARGIGGKLLEEISALGPKAAGQVASFADMTEEELNKYVELWTRKNELAKETAISQLTSMKEDIDKQMIEINEDAEKQLAKYKDEYEFMFKELNGVASSEMDVLQNNLNTDGRNAMQGLIDGMESMKNNVIATAQSIASAVSSTIQSALDIHSPSRLMRGFGVNIGQGLVLGMDDMLSKVTEASKRLASSVEDNTSYTQGTQSNIDNSKHFKPSVVIHTNDSGAREMERTLRRMQFGF